MEESSKKEAALGLLTMYLKRKGRSEHQSFIVEEMFGLDSSILYAPLYRPAAISIACQPKANALYWERVLACWNYNHYKEHLRLKRETFEFLCGEIQSYISKASTNYKEPISVECRVAIALWRLGGGASYREIGENFGLGKSTVFVVTMEVCSVLAEHFLPIYVKIPSNVQLASQAFCIEKGLPNCIGAVDGCHIPIPKPNLNGDDYWNRKCFYSINVQAVVDHKGRFIDVVIGWPGKVHDARVFCNSTIYSRASRGDLFPESDLMIGDQKIPYYILGDSAYPLESWLMKPFLERGDPHEELFNTKLSKARMVVERAFGRLKQRWRCLLKCCNACPKNAKLVIASCIILHNLCEERGDSFEDQLVVEVGFDDEGGNSDASLCGRDIRNALKSFLARV